MEERNVLLDHAEAILPAGSAAALGFASEMEEKKDELEGDDELEFEDEEDEDEDDLNEAEFDEANREAEVETDETDETDEDDEEDDA